MSITLNGEDDGSTVLNPEIFWLEKALQDIPSLGTKRTEKSGNYLAAVFYWPIPQYHHTVDCYIIQGMCQSDMIHQGLRCKPCLISYFYDHEFSFLTQIIGLTEKCKVTTSNPHLDAGTFVKFRPQL
ncbi:hypothetical protein OUZ56_008891 [Daphnia magna]|uniref:Uncharacterized protein n=1 Tax=Daphnia magna TaxID=35525 RepID=A0ABR0AEL0_9CRUS|nr:hypothetical protein OUZ56_008891 [Daphnia magna]